MEGSEPKIENVKSKTDEHIEKIMTILTGVTNQISILQSQIAEINGMIRESQRYSRNQSYSPEHPYFATPFREPQLFDRSAMYRPHSWR